MSTGSNTDRLERWRLVLGGGEADGTGAPLEGHLLAIDRTLAALYDRDDAPRRGRGGLGASAPTAARWLGDIREYFPSSVVRVMQKDAIERLGMDQLLLEPEMLEAVEPDINLVTTLMSLSGAIPAKAKATAREIVRRVVRDLMRKLEAPTRQAVTGALKRSSRTRRPRHNEIDWNRTIRANLKHYQPEHRTIVPETRIGYGRKRTELRTVIVCIDQSGSMGESVVYSGVFGAVLASIPAMKSHVVAFDTAVVDLTEKMSDPVDVLMGVQLGGGTDINLALSYCQGLITRPADTVLVLISDLYEGGDQKAMLKRVRQITTSGVKMVALLALGDHGAAIFDTTVASKIAAMGVPSFACTPDRFPDLLAAALQGSDLGSWASAQGLTTTRASTSPEP
ncbi:MAG: VWA domain-containing protein [Planctomycetaceae bacterium]|jgi:Mg-chelatase subunit ChlD|nr:VWA domain-containing protein [Phycisphaerales bacterium]MCE2651990.1 VWA domain-containing protein [Planctomycetaceae bacterium]